MLSQPVVPFSAHSQPPALPVRAEAPQARAPGFPRQDSPVGRQWRRRWANIVAYSDDSEARDVPNSRPVPSANFIRKGGARAILFRLQQWEDRGRWPDSRGAPDATAR